MTLVDTSVWIDQRRRGNGRLAAALGRGRVDAHLLAAASLSDTPLLTLDRALRRAAEALDVFGEPEV